MDLVLMKLTTIGLISSFALGLLGPLPVEALEGEWRCIHPIHETHGEGGRVKQYQERPGCQSEV
jgi:hypothetical protein